MYNEFSLKQLKIVNNGLYLTKDGWETIETGVGRFTYTDINGNLVEDYGIIAKTVVGNLIIGKELQIYNEDKSIVIDETGLTIDGGYLKIKGTEVGSDGKTISEVIIDLDTAQKLVALAQQAADKAQESANQAQASADKANKATEDLKVETNEIRELAEKGVDHVTTYFYQSDSATELVGGEWTTNSVTWISGKYVWQKVITYYKDRTDNSQTAKAICISGANGQDGKDYFTNIDDIRYRKNMIGLIAENVYDNYKIAADWHVDEESGKVLVDAWNEQYIVPAMLKLIQEQHKEIEKLKQIIGGE